MIEGVMRLRDVLSLKQEPVETPVSLVATSLMPQPSELSDSVHVLSESVATSLPQQAPASDAESDADAQTAVDVSEAWVDDASEIDLGYATVDDTTMSEIALSRGTEQPLLREVVTQVHAPDTLANFVLQAGFTQESAAAVEAAAQAQLQRS